MQMLPNISTEQVTNYTLNILGKMGVFHLHFTQISENVENAEWCGNETRQTPHPALEISSFTLLGQRKPSICMCCFFNLISGSQGSFTHRSTCWNLVFINSWDIVRDDKWKRKKGEMQQKDTGERSCEPEHKHQKISFSAAEWTISLSTETELK